ncbi:hypothetical protein A2U01_0110987 [Trifolium medium]|uniref:Uncharacterized protein n=1 Tax=Trifolium medium TaxID=97028 RepID=A0A392VMS5_9FABA|nr:hypothetical protein [Trifolium medium]
MRAAQHPPARSATTRKPTSPKPQLCARRSYSCMRRRSQKNRGQPNNSIASGAAQAARGADARTCRKMQF